MARRIAENAGTDPKIVVECSTMPVTTAETMRKVGANSKEPNRLNLATQDDCDITSFAGCAELSPNGQVFNAVGHAKYEVLCFPSFYRGGSALQYLQNPVKVLLGSNDTVSGLVAFEVFRDVLAPWIPKESESQSAKCEQSDVARCPECLSFISVAEIVHSSLWSAELAKLAQNAMVAQRISSTNAVSALCEKTGADLDEVMKVVGSDSRISSGYLSACPSMGGATLLQNLSMYADPR